MQGWYSPETNSYYEAERQSHKDHVAVPMRPGVGWQWDVKASEWVYPEWRIAVDERKGALAELAATDWRVIRAMEQWMAAHDGLPAEFLAERTALRVKASD